jgi:hypothetical protein
VQRKIKEGHHGYSNADAVFHVVHNLEYGALDVFIPHTCVRWRFCLQDAQQMVFHATGNVQRCALLVHWYVQNHRYRFQRNTLGRTGDNRLKKRQVG